MFDASFPSHPSWNVFTQWHQSALCCGSPPVSFYVQGERIYLGIMDQPVWSVPLNRGVWNDFIFHVRWSDNPGVGFIELYFNGELVIPRRATATNMSGQLNYLKQGLYRDEAIAPDGIVYHDAMVQATSLADVLPPPTPAQPDAGSPGGGQTPDAGSPLTSGGGTPNGTTTSALPNGTQVATGGCSAGSGLIPALALVLAPILLVIRFRSAQRARSPVRRYP
jgi:Polysaccharide lyase